MLISAFFPKNFQTLRNAHNLGIRDIADMLNVKSATNISSWEHMRSIPSLEAFNETIILFAINPAWLLGFTDNPYDEKIISTIENALFSQSIEYNGVNVPLLRKVSWIPEEYWNPELRSKTYSLPVRANIIFLLHIYISEQISKFEETEKINASSLLRNAIMRKAKELQAATTSYQKKRKQLDFYMKSLQELLAAKESAKPIFDIEAQKTTEE